MDLNNKMITLDNGCDYIVVGTAEYEGRQYAYLVNKDEKIDTKVVEVFLERGQVSTDVDRKLIIENLLPLFVGKNNN